MKTRFLLASLLLVLFLPLQAQRPAYGKMSPMVRKMVRQHERQLRRMPAAAPAQNETDDFHTCVFIRITENASEVMALHQCRQLAQYGDIYIVDVPLSQVSVLSSLYEVKRIEAEPMSKVLMDTTRIIVGGKAANEGLRLPQGYTGKGVIIGVEDIGFDLTHPTFYSRDLSTYRINRLWDMLADDGDNSTYVGAQFTTREAILAHTHSRDGLDQTHGTHTAGIAAGSGYTSPYQGIAPESELCLVSNAVTEDTVFIAKEDFYRFTTATDALGFKYIFDYADEVGKPCVISFSEGYTDMLRTSNLLFYEVLERMTGPGRIFVTAAGNSGYLPSYVLKPRGVESAGCFLLDNGNLIRHQISANGSFSFQISIYADTSSPYIYKANTEQILERPDSNLTDTIQVGGEQYVIDIIAFPNPFDAFATGYELTITGPRYFAFKVPFSLQVIGKESRVELLRMYGEFTTNDLNPALHDAVLGHHILAPASAPAAIAVGSNAYITGHYNYLGEWKNSNGGVDGVRADMSSIGPTLDGLIKPDVMAPGQNIISSYSSYYLENHPQAGDITWDVEHFQYNGRTYPWNSNSGTSMACPVVAGVVALWLQACPTLTPDDVLHIIATTSTHPVATLTYPNNEYGYGQIDAAAGLRYIVSTAIREMPADTPARQTTYNLMGQPVGSHYRGIVIRGGRKYTQK